MTRSSDTEIATLGGGCFWCLEAALGQLAGVHSVVSGYAVSPAPTFWPAEDEHRDYFAHHPFKPYCQAVGAPKVAKLQLAFAARLKH